MTTYTPKDLLTAERHIAEGEQHIVRQEELVTRLRVAGRETATAEALLAEFQRLLKLHRDDRDNIAAALDAATRQA